VFVSGAYAESEAVEVAYLAIAYASIAIYLPTIFSAFVHVKRRHDLDVKRRERWYFALFFLNVLVLPYFWVRMIRPLKGRPMPTG
jgi:hypothetical protein